MACLPLCFNDIFFGATCQYNVRLFRHQMNRRNGRIFLCVAEEFPAYYPYDIFEEQLLGIYLAIDLASGIMKAKNMEESDEICCVTTRETL